jgi:CYTH domain-containing protein
MKYARVERERRFLIPSMPPGPFVRTVRIADRYIHGTRLRLREMIDDAASTSVFKLTQKLPATADSQALITTIYVRRAEYEVLCALPASVITKTRHSWPPFGIDVFDAPHAGLLIAEAEFDDDAAMAALTVPPGWIEVTTDLRYSGAVLAASHR